MKIITVTLNPCIDVNYKTDISFEAGKLNRVPAPEVSYNGKGINVSRELRSLSEYALRSATEAESFSHPFEKRD